MKKSQTTKRLFVKAAKIIAVGFILGFVFGILRNGRWSIHRNRGTITIAHYEGTEEALKQLCDPNNNNTVTIDGKSPCQNQ